MQSKSSGASEQAREDAFDWSNVFDWSLTEALQHITDVCRWKAQRACAELDRAIGMGELRHRFFKRVDGKLVSKQEGSPEFWRTDVTLRFVDKDADGNVIEPDVQVWPKHIGFVDRPKDITCRVRSRDIQGKYTLQSSTQAVPYAHKSRTETMILIWADELFPDGWEQYPTNALMSRIDKRFTDKELPVPDRSTFERAFDRRK